jgi:hypothetical protein
VSWTNQVVNIANGSHTLNWCYQKDNSTTLGADAGWVDQVSYTSLATMAVFPTVTETNFSVTVATLTGYLYTLEYTDSLTPPINWTPLPPGVAGDGTLKPLTHITGSAGVAQRFYQVHISQ